MDAETRRLRQRLSDAGHVPDIVILKQTTTSTNDDVRELAQKNIASILICSEAQTQGRGQHQRQWISPKGNIYLSTLINSRTPLDGRLALEVALNILQMPKLHGLNLQVKWPNDLYSSQGKWGGILVEPLSPHQAIVGVGVNLFTPQSHDPLQPISSLSDFGLNNLDRIEIVAQLYLAIQQAAQWFEHGCYNLADRFNHHAVFMQEQVQFEHHQGILTGRFEGINQEGAVLISNNGQQQTFYQGRMRRILGQDDPS
ncbi:biotin--[acetyl-CoA-carboxylase] ligase [Acinetobacter sp. S40]|uniref:biotin--[acetyl-CoA-carboxylase] ligase n=1 Tax=Acinetobacter sp. S40 TaxID=2767434 RepID=UPI00190CEBB7|nr:biotin--[acetyl-CoA-carboxylase] ligase [Acinetobacter sp. S40]MBJ9986613.1 biotin--[acetyl-CoA-carboxylase] ligase [Acinetobacter sp. S40]